MAPRRMKTAPKTGRFLAWRPSYQEWMTVTRWNATASLGDQKTVVHGPSGTMWVAEWWAPLPTKPKKDR